jgi:hypothetical protein
MNFNLLERCQITRVRDIWFKGYAALLIVLTSLPYAIALQQDSRLNPQSTWIFSGFVFGVTDGNSYIAKMRTGTEGAWLFRSPYTHMPQSGVIAFLPYLLLGKLASPPQVHLKLILLFHIFRILAGVLNIWATYQFLALFIGQRRIRQIALIMITAGGGLGWLLLFAKDHAQLPLELYSPESFGFLSLYGLPHLALGRAALLWTLIAYVRLWQTPSWRRTIVLCLSWLLAGVCQPIQAAMAAGIIVPHWVSRWIFEKKKKSAETQSASQSTRILAYLLAGSAPAATLLTYTAYKFIRDPYLRIWSVQNVLTTAPVSTYLASYGWLMPLAFFGALTGWKSNRLQTSLAVIWMTVGLMGICFPISIQRRLIEGFWVALVVLTFAFFDKPPRWLHASWQTGVVSGLLAFSLPTTFLLLAGGIQTAKHPAEPVFLPREQVAMFELLDTQDTPESSLVLASFDTSNALPAYTSAQVLIGHGPESAGGKTWQDQIEAVYHQETSDDQRIRLLDTYHVDYLIWSPSERALGEWNPYKAGYLQLIAERDSFSLFRVIH